MGPADIPHDFAALSLQCAPTVHVRAMNALVHVESSFRQFAIAVVDGPQVRQPRTLQEAVAVVGNLERKGLNYSVGYAQVNKVNFKKQGLTIQTAFDACSNIRAGSRILEDCFQSAKKRYSQNDQVALRAAYSCYYSGNFLRGFRPDKQGQSSYVERVIRVALGTPDATPRKAPQPHHYQARGLGAGWGTAYLSDRAK